MILMFSCLAVKNAYAINPGPLINIIFKTAPKAAVKIGKITKGGISLSIKKITKKHGVKSHLFLKTNGYKGMKILEKTPTKSGAKIMYFSEKHGKKAWPIIENSITRSLLLKHGEIAGKVMIKHPGISRDTIKKYGISSIHALDRVEKGIDLIRYGKLLLKTPKLFDHGVDINNTISSHGKPALDFLWDNRYFLASSTVAITAFFDEPDLYINGAINIKNLGNNNNLLDYH